MALSVKTFGGTDIILDRFHYDIAQSCYALKSTSDREIEINIEYPLEYISGYKKADFDLFLFARKNFSENKICQVYEKGLDQRIGWIFPLQALNSKEHDYASNEHFLKYAKVSFDILCSGVENVFKESPLFKSGNYLINDFYSDETVVFSLSKNSLPAQFDFQINDYLPSFFGKGFFYQTSRNPKNLRETVLSLELLDGNRVTISKMSPGLKSKKFIRSLLVEILPYESNYLIAFFYLYQIIEMLIGEVYNIKQIDFAKKISDNLNKPSEVKEILSDLNQSLSEKKRIHSLFEQHLLSKPDENSLKNACNDFLEKNKYQPGDHFSKYLYRVRNIIFHQFYEIQYNAESDLRDIVVGMEQLIPELIINFKQ